MAFFPGPGYIPPPKTPQQVEEDAERIRGSNRGGDDTITRVVFVVVVLAIVAFAVRFWIVGHGGHVAPP